MDQTWLSLTLCDWSPKPDPSTEGEHEGDENEPGRVNIAETECRCVFFVVSPGGDAKSRCGWGRIAWGIFCRWNEVFNGWFWMILICYVHFNILNEHVFYIWSNALETKWGFSGKPCLISRGCAGKVVCSSLMLIPLLSLGNCINYYSPPFQVFNHIISHSYKKK